MALSSLYSPIHIHSRCSLIVSFCTRAMESTQWCHTRHRRVTPWAPPAWLLLGRTPPPESLSFGQKGLGLGDGVGAAWPMDKLLSAWGPQMGRNKARVLLGVPAVGVHPAPACPTFLPQCSFLAPSSSGGSLTCYFQGCGESTYSENIKNTSQTVDGKNQK